MGPKEASFPSRTHPTWGLLGSPPWKKPVLRVGILT